MHLQQAPDALFLALGRDEHVSPEFSVPEYTRKNVRLPTNGSFRILKASAANGASSLAARVVGSPCSSMPLIGRHLDRRGHELDDRIEQRLHALVLEGGAAHAQHDLVADRARVRRPMLDLLLGERARLEILVRQLFVAFGGGLDHLGAIFVGLGLELGRDRRGIRTSCPGSPCPSRSPSCG